MRTCASRDDPGIVTVILGWLYVIGSYMLSRWVDLKDSP